MSILANSSIRSNARDGAMYHLMHQRDTPVTLPPQRKPASAAYGGGFRGFGDVDNVSNVARAGCTDVRDPGFPAKCCQGIEMSPLSPK